MTGVHLQPEAHRQLLKKSHADSLSVDAVATGSRLLEASKCQSAQDLDVVLGRKAILRRH